MQKRKPGQGKRLEGGKRDRMGLYVGFEKLHFLNEGQEVLRDRHNV
jgi:hypothetical protein